MHIIAGFIILSIASGLLVFLFYILYTIPVKHYVDREQKEEKLRIQKTTYPKENITESEWYKHIATQAELNRTY